MGSYGGRFPADGDGFIARLEALVGRVLLPTKGGRPRKQGPQRGKQKQQKHG